MFRVITVTVIIIQLIGFQERTSSFYCKKWIRTPPEYLAQTLVFYTQTQSLVRQTIDSFELVYECEKLRVKRIFSILLKIYGLPCQHSKEIRIIVDCKYLVDDTRFLTKLRRVSLSTFGGSLGYYQLHQFQWDYNRAPSISWTHLRSGS